MSCRRIVYVSGTRADFGLLASTLLRADADPRLDVSICVTGMHLLPEFGLTVREIEATGLNIMARIPVDLAAADGAGMARALGQALIGMTEAFAAYRPDLVLLLGDRGEMLAGALAALHLNIPIVHLHGGERSGTVDEPVRHAISKLSHYHFTATTSARERLVRMGEHPDKIFVTGAPGLDDLSIQVNRDRPALCDKYQLDPARPVALVVFHPVVQEACSAGTQMEYVLGAVRTKNMQALCLMPNADAGNESIRAALEARRGDPDVRLVTHLPRAEFISWLAVADLQVGNSSSGIIEAASFGLPVVNVGSRQNEREQSGNVVDCDITQSAIIAAIEAAETLRGRHFINVYGDGNAGERIVERMATLPLDPSLLCKKNAY
jgi:GDP/UDP-N,N'-diacetylbacillosamine 2-epimerase (hydrolysing)